jgi:beta-N-acetylhexosaminidase
VVAEVSLRDKIGQMLIVGFEGNTLSSTDRFVARLSEYNLGGVILFDYNLQTNTYSKNIENSTQLIALTQSLQHYTEESNTLFNRPQLPLIISIDYEGGEVCRLSTQKGFPPTLSAYELAKLDPEKARGEAVIMANTLKQLGINVNFAPTVDLNVNADNPVIAKRKRSFSSNPKKVVEYASMVIDAYQQANILPVLKHFPGHGSSSTDSHLGFVDVSNGWKACELYPFQALIQTMGNRAVVMTAHIVNHQLDKSGLPATLSNVILQQLLRKELGFDGVIISDDMQMKAISEHYGLEEALILAINAGVNMFIFGNQLIDIPQEIDELITLIEGNVKNKTIELVKIEDSYQRILQVKKVLAK